MLATAIGEFKKTNKLKAVNFSKNLNALVEKYNDRDEQDVLRSEVINDFSEDIKAEIQVDLILLLDKYGYPPVDEDEVYKEIFEQAQNFKMNKEVA